MTKNRTPTLVYLDPGMHPGLEVKGLTLGLKVRTWLKEGSGDIPLSRGGNLKIDAI